MFIQDKGGKMIDKICKYGMNVFTKKVQGFFNGNNDLDNIMVQIRAEISKDYLYIIFEDDIRKELKNYHYQHWDGGRVALVAEKVARMITLFSYEEDSYIPKEEHILRVQEISKGIMETIVDQAIDPELEQAIKERCKLRVCQSVAKGASSSVYVYQTIKDHEKTHLLSSLLFAGVDISDKVKFPEPLITSRRFAAWKDGNPLLYEYNHLSYAVYCQNEVAIIEILRIDASCPIYHLERLKKCYDQALSVALCKYKETKSDLAVKIIIMLLDAGAKLSARYDNMPIGEKSTYSNNLVFIVNTDLQDLLKAILESQRQKESFTADISNAMNCVLSEESGNEILSTDILMSCILSGKSGSDTLLTDILVKCRSSKDPKYKNMALLLFRAGANLCNIRNASPYPQYNILQLIIKFGLTELLSEALDLRNKPPGYKAVLANALTYTSAHPSNSSRLAAKDLAQNEYEKELRRWFKTNITHDTRQQIVKIIDEFLINEAVDVNNSNNPGIQKGHEQAQDVVEVNRAPSIWASFFHVEEFHFNEEEIRYEEEYQRAYGVSHDQ